MLFVYKRISYWKLILHWGFNMSMCKDRSQIRFHLTQALLKLTGAYHCSDSPLFRRPIIPTTHYSDSPLLRRPIFRTMQNRTQSTNPWFNQDGPSVRLILTDHGLDRMFWKGKGAFILGCTSPLKAIMIDRPGMGKVKNWRKSCIAQRNQKRGVKEKGVNREKHEKDKMTEESNTHGSEES